MPGFTSSDEYDNATVSQWLMSLGQRLYQRICGGNFEYDSGTTNIETDNKLGGLSPVATRLAAGDVKVQYAPTGFKVEGCVFPMPTSVNDQAFLYYADNDGFKVMEFNWGGAEFAFSDEPFYIYCLGR